MKIIKILALPLLAIFVVYYIAGDNFRDYGQARDCRCLPLEDGTVDGDTSTLTEVREGLLASRFNSLEELKLVVGIQYFRPPSEGDTTGGYSRVRLRHCSNGREVWSELESGLKQDEIMNVRIGGVRDKAWLLMRSPFAVANRVDIVRIFNLARRKSYLFGNGDVAFFDLAERSVENISTHELAYRHPRDSSEKGYLNSFNHITAQAFITSFFSEEMADFLSDVHERNHMPELMSGNFTVEQLAHVDNNPVDNYVDMVNNEWGQEIGKELKVKYGIDGDTYWTPQLLTDYLNDLQDYYSWAFQIGFVPFSVDDEVVVRYVAKINVVMGGEVPLLR